MVGMPSLTRTEAAARAEIIDVAKLSGEEPGQQIYDDLRNLKQVMEVGEVVVSDGTVWDNGYLTQRPAQPASAADLAQSQGAH